MSKPKTGFVYIIGTGAGAVELISLEAIRAIEAAQVIVYDDLIDKAILGYANPFSKFIYVGKRKGRGPKQAAINRILLKWARKGFLVARLKGGDPFIFGRGGEEVLALAAARIPYSVIPGITAALAASAASGIPITHRSLASSVVFFTGHREDGSVNAPPYTPSLSAVAYMSASIAGDIARTMIRLGWPPETGVVAVTAAYTEGQKVKTFRLFELATGKVTLESPVIMIFGRHTSLFEHLCGMRKKRISVTLTRQYDPSEMASLRAKFPALNIFSVPLIRTEDLAFERTLELEMERYYDAVILTSATTCKILSAKGYLRRLLDGKTVISIGRGTSRAAANSFARVMYQTATESSEEISPLVRRLRPSRVLYPCAQQRNKNIAASIRKSGISITEIPIYTIRKCTPNNVDLLTISDYIVVSSSLQASALLRHKMHIRGKILSFPHATAKTLRSLNIEHTTLDSPDIERALATINS